MKPILRILPAAGQARAVVLVLHGGREFGQGRAHRLRLAYLRMLPFARDLHAAAGDRGLDVWLLRYRKQGWNAPELDPVADARWALERIREQRPGLPVALLGHSMGGRVALHVADDPAVTAVCALAPWTVPDTPVEQLAGRTVLIAHGDGDRITDPRLSYRYATRAKQVTDRVVRYDVPGERHAMLKRPGDWTRLVRRFVLGALDIEPFDPELANAIGQPVPDGLRVRL